MRAYLKDLVFLPEVCADQAPRCLACPLRSSLRTLGGRHKTPEYITAFDNCHLKTITHVEANNHLTGSRPPFPFLSLNIRLSFLNNKQLVKKPLSETLTSFSYHQEFHLMRLLKVLIRWLISSSSSSSPSSSSWVLSSSLLLS